MEPMRKMSQKKKKIERKKISSRNQVTKTYYERKSSGSLQHKVWKLEEVQETTKKQHNRETYGARGRLQYKVWDLGGFHKNVKHMVRIS